MSGVKRKVCVREEVSSVIPKKHGRRSRNVREELDDVFFVLYFLFKIYFIFTLAVLLYK